MAARRGALMDNRASGGAILLRFWFRTVRPDARCACDTPQRVASHTSTELIERSWA